MARKKSVPISRKPLADEALPVISESAESASLPPLNLKLQPYAETLAEPQAARSLCPAVRVVYGTVYCLSYGVVVSAILLGKLIPGSGLLGHAIQDGAGAASRRFGGQAAPCSEAKAAELAA
jgi:hypothetical protein